MKLIKQTSSASIPHFLPTPSLCLPLSLPELFSLKGFEIGQSNADSYAGTLDVGCWDSNSLVH